MTKAKREFSSGGILIRSRGSIIKILLIKDLYGKWTWPKGKIDKGETSIDAAKREVKEETGLENIQMVSKIGNVNYFYTRSKELIFKTVHLYLFRFVGQETLSIQKEEIKDGRWFSEEGALSKVAYKGAKELLNKAIKIYKRYMTTLQSQVNSRRKQ